MRAGLIVVGRIRGQDLPQMLHAEDKNVIQTVVPERSNQSFKAEIQRPVPPPADASSIDLVHYH
jgi:hypothetical protein